MAYGGSQRIGPNFEADLSGIVPFSVRLRPASHDDEDLRTYEYLLDRVTLHSDVVARRTASSSSPPTATSSASPSATFYKGVVLGDEVYSSSVFDWMRDLLNLEIRSGDTYPFEEEMHDEAFANYFFARDTFVLYRVKKEKGKDEEEEATTTTKQNPKKDRRLESTADLVGCFYIKGNFPGRSSHICNAGFLVAPSYRSRGAGFVMGERLRHLAKALGYRGIMFNLVYASNIASNKLWPKLGFEQIGVLKGAGRLRQTAVNGEQKEEKGEEVFVDAVLWQFDLTVKEIPYVAPSW